MLMGWPGCNGNLLGTEAVVPFNNWALEYHTLILFLKGTIMIKKFILFSPWLLKSPDNNRKRGTRRLLDGGFKGLGLRCAQSFFMACILSRACLRNSHLP